MKDFHKRGFVDVDRLVEQIDLPTVFNYYGQSFPFEESKANVRIDCPIADCEPSSYGKLSVGTTVPYRIKCHTCGVSGNIFTLMWILKHQQPPTGGRLRGEEFNEIKQDLVAITQGDTVAAVQQTTSKTIAPKEVTDSAAANQPLAHSDSERIRSLVDLHRKGTTDLAEMTPAASRYFRERSFLTPEMCEKWNVAFLPAGNGTLQRRVIYPINGVDGQRLAWAGRDPDYEQQHQRWLKQRGKNEPMKFRFPSDKFFRRGLELYGQDRRRLEEPGYREAIEQIGILVVEGMNDVIAFDALEQPALGLMSNRVTEEQAHKVITWAQSLANGKVTLMLDGDANGVEGAKESLWRLAQETPVQTVVLKDDRQPEHLSADEWKGIKEKLIRQWQSS